MRGGLGILILVLAACGSAVPTASNTPASSPTAVPSAGSSSPAGLWPRAANLAYSSTAQQILLFGGARSVPLNDTWMFDGTHWAMPPQAQTSTSATSARTSGTPSIRQGAAVTDDPDLHAVLLFGGDNSGVFLGDTWIWVGAAWKQVFPVHSPSPRTGASITWDSVHHVAVLFGGYAGGTLSDTWLWNGSDWTMAATADSPNGRYYAPFAFDGGTGEAVLFGGFGNLNDTWTWDGSNWTRQSPANTPPGTNQATPRPQQMAYDSVRHLVVMVDQTQHGSFTADDTMDTWTWDGHDWTRQSPTTAPPLRDGFGLAFDSALGMTVLAGGFAFGSSTDATSTWGWNGTDWSKIG